MKFARKVLAHTAVRVAPQRSVEHWADDSFDGRVVQRALARPHAIDARAVLALQASAGNRSVAALLSGLTVQRCGTTPCDCSADERESHQQNERSSASAGGTSIHQPPGALDTAQAGPEEDAIDDPDCGVTEQARQDSAPNGLTFPSGPGTVNFSSGTCSNGGGESRCDARSGRFAITAINNDCCTRPCTQQHEEQHVKDYTAWGCCKKLGEKSDSADFTGHQATYERWSNQVRPISECRAYKADVKCATAMQKAKNCGTKRQKAADADCCLDLSDYIRRYQSAADDWCAKAPSKAPPCPLFI